MKLTKLHPDDLRWLSRWLRSNLVCVLAIFCFLMVIRNNAPSRSTTAGQARAEQAEAAPPATDAAPAELETTLPPESELVLLPSRRPNPVAPKGWRRTKHGWEHVSTWRPIPRPLGQIIETQFDREPAWARLMLERLRGVPPLMFALIQVTAIAAIVNVSASKNQLDGRPASEMV